MIEPVTPRDVLADFMLQGHLTYRVAGRVSDFDCADAMIRDLEAEGIAMVPRSSIAAERDEAREQPWPEWAEKLLRLLESWGAEYEADDEINLPDELAEWLHHYASELKRAALSTATKQAASKDTP